MDIETGASKVLIVDDDPVVRELYQITFGRGHGFEAIIKSTPSEGLAYFKDNQDTTHLVILDRDLPGMLGEVVAERMRQISGQPDDPYILMISGRQDLDINSLRAHGVDKLIIKPFSPMALLKTVDLANQRFQSPKP